LSNLTNPSGSTKPIVTLEIYKTPAHCCYHFSSDEIADREIAEYIDILIWMSHRVKTPEKKEAYASALKGFLQTLLTP
jgi:hypothetical protein